MPEVESNVREWRQTLFGSSIHIKVNGSHTCSPSYLPSTSLRRLRCTGHSKHLVHCSACLQLPKMLKILTWHFRRAQTRNSVVHFLDLRAKQFIPNSCSSPSNRLYRLPCHLKVASQQAQWKAINICLRTRARASQGQLSTTTSPCNILLGMMRIFHSALVSSSLPVADVQVTDLTL